MIISGIIGAVDLLRFANVVYNVQEFTKTGVYPHPEIGEHILEFFFIHGIRDNTDDLHWFYIKRVSVDHPLGKIRAEGIEQAKLIVKSGADAIEVSEGLEEDFFHHIRMDAVNPYYLEECQQVKQALSVPVMLIGGMRDVRDMQAVLDDGIADAVSIYRPFIMNPYLVKDIREGSSEGSQCTSCNQCMAQMQQGQLKFVLV